MYERHEVTEVVSHVKMTKDLPIVSVPLSWTVIYCIIIIVVTIFAGQADSEAEDSEMTEKLQSNERDAEENNQSNDLSQSEDENEPMETEDTKQNREEHSSLLDKKDNDCDRLENGHVSPSLLEVMKKCNFPSDILTLKKVDESVCYETGIPWIVSSSIPLPKGSSIGPYTGKVVPLSELKEKEHILQV